MDSTRLSFSKRYKRKFLQFSSYLPSKYETFLQNPYTAEEKTNFASTKRASLSREKEVSFPFLM